MPDDVTPQRVLDTPMADNDAGTIRDYLKTLLAALWTEGDMFSAKRPLGSSDWQWEVYRALVRANIVTGDTDADGDISGVDELTADDLIVAAIGALR